MESRLLIAKACDGDSGMCARGLRGGGCARGGESEAGGRGRGGLIWRGQKRRG